MFKLRMTTVLVVTAGLVVAPVVGPVWASPKPVAPSVHEVRLSGVDAVAFAAAPAAADPAGLRAPVAPGAPVLRRADPATVPTVFTGELATGRFTAAGVRWSAQPAVGRVVVQVRIREQGSWTSWSELAPSEAPDSGTAEGRNAATIGSTEPISSPDADAIQVRVDTEHGAPPNLELLTIDPGTSPADGNLLGTPAASAQAAAAAPLIIPRAAWGADESLLARNGPCPGEMSGLKVGFVHHTVSSNAYNPGDSAGMVRGIYAYHVTGNGWCDIGYNMLVDKYGQIFEGRHGGTDRPVQGAHTLSFNDQSFGIAAIGTYSTTAGSAAMLGSISKVLGWKLSLYRIGANDKSILRSGGGAGAKYPVDTMVTFNAISGHRDGYATECPGNVLYSQLPALRSLAAAVPGQQSGTTISLVGHGYGHGIGLGQWGAYGYAVDQGWTWQMILDHYYGGTTSGTIPAGSISVALSTPASTWITSGRAITIGDPANPASRAHVAAGSAARLSWTGTGWVVYARFNGCTGTDSYGPYPVAGSTVWLDSDPGATGTDTQLLKTCSTATSYRGQLRGAVNGAVVQLVNDLPMEQYLRSVVPSESPASWADARSGWGINALKAQAVAARSYAATEARSAAARTCDTTACQVYSGAYRGGVLLEDQRTDAAVTGTAGVVRRNPGGTVARTQFSSSTGGFTAGAGFTRVADQGDSRSPNHTWTAQLDGDTVAAAYGAGKFIQLLVTQQAPGGPEGGRVLQVTVVGTAGSPVATGAAFRATWGLRSDWFFPVVQPLQETTGTAYIKHAYGDTVYRQFALGWGHWSDHAPLTYAEYAAAGFPALTTVPTEYVRYTWSPAIYAVSFWPGEPSWQWHQLTFAEWSRVGYPAARTAGFIYGTMFYTVGASPVIYANSPDGVLHPLTYAEWSAAGFPPPVRR